jgi:hypothetical protein
VVVDVGEENQDGLDLLLRKGATVTGRVRIAGRDAPLGKPALPTADVKVDVEPLVRMRFMDERPSPVDAATGVFTIEGVPADTYYVKVDSPPQGYKVSAVRYAGMLCPHSVVAIAPDAHGSGLEITLSAADGSVMVTAADRSNPAPGAAVLLVPEGAVNKDVLYRVLRQATADKNGQAIIADLLPGTYRVAAYAQGVLWGDDPELEHRLARGEEVRIASKQTALAQVPVHTIP